MKSTDDMADLLVLHKFALAETKGDELAAMTSVLRAFAVSHGRIPGDVVVRRTTEETAKAICEHFRITTNDLYGRKRTKKIAGARMILMHFLALTNLDHSEIAQMVGRTRQDVSHAVSKVWTNSWLSDHAAEIAAEIAKGDSDRAVPAIWPVRRLAR